MSALQEQAVQMIRSLSDDNVSFLIEIIRRLMLQKPPVEMVQQVSDEAMQAFNRLNSAWTEIRQFYPNDFDPDRELEEALEERYGGID